MSVNLVCNPEPQDIFPELSGSIDELKELFQVLSLTDVVVFCARICMLFFSSEEHGGKQSEEHGKKQKEILKLFFSDDPETQKRIEAFVKERGGIDNVSFCCPGAIHIIVGLSSLLSENKEDDGKSFEKPESRIAFAKILLLISRHWLSEIKGDNLPDDKSITDARKKALQTFARNVSGNSVLLEPIPAVARGVNFFVEDDGFSKFYDQFEDVFFQETGLSLQEYYQSLILVSSYYLNLRGPDHQIPDTFKGIFSLSQSIDGFSNDDAKKVMEKFIKNEVIDTDKVQKEFWKGKSDITSYDDIKAANPTIFLNHPIFSADSDRVMLIDPSLFIQKISLGPLFTVVRSGKKSISDNEVFGHFGNFFEKYCGKILSKIYPDSPTLSKRLFVDPKGKNLNKGSEIQITDMYLESVDSCVFFECKANVFTQEAIVSGTIEEFLSKLDKKFVANENDRGLIQLSNAISNIEKGLWEPNDFDLSKKKRIFPVLVVLDPFLRLDNFSNYFAIKFANFFRHEELRCDMQIGRFSVANLITLHIEELEFFEESVKLNFAMANFLSDYAADCPERLMSVTEYVSKSKYKEQFRPNKRLIKKGLALMGSAKEFFYKKNS